MFVGLLCKCTVQGRGSFPCEVSILEIQEELDWNPQVTVLSVWPLYICDDGAVIYYRQASSTLQLSECHLSTDLVVFVGIVKKSSWFSVKQGGVKSKSRKVPDMPNPTQSIIKLLSPDCVHVYCYTHFSFIFCCSVLLIIPCRH